MRNFDPRVVGAVECRAWESYYAGASGLAFLIASVRMVRAAFRMSWPRTLEGAWLACGRTGVGAGPRQRPGGSEGADGALLPAPGPRARARASTRLTPPSSRSSGGARTGPTSATASPSRRSSAALGDLYAYSYDADPAEVRRAAELRAEAMDVSDDWVSAGCDPDDPRLAREGALLVRSYASLLAAVHR